MTPTGENEHPARPDSGWHSTWVLRRVVVLFVVSTGMTLVFGRPAIALAILPLGVGTALAMAGRRGRPRPRLRIEMPRIAEVDGPAAAVISVGGLAAAEIVVLRIPHGIGSPSAPYVVLAADPPDQQLTVRVDTSRWGMRDYGAAGVRAATADGLFATPVGIAHTAPVRILPPARTADVPELPARSAGQVGAHRTRRPGDGSELLDVRQFRPGDRIRRIDWRVSARRGVLHVRHTAIDADADLVVCLDTRYNLTPDVMSWHDRSSSAGQPGSLDVAIIAATTLAASYLRLGDRVGLIDLAVPYRGVRPGTGVRQLMRIRWHLAGIVPDAQLRRRRFDEGSVPPGAAVVVLSPYIDDQIDPLVGTLARTHRDVLGIDVLPDSLTMPTDRAELAATRLVLAERADRLAALARRGVLVTKWDPGLIRLLMRRRQRLRRSA